MTRKRPLTSLLLSGILLLALLLPISACERHNHFNAASFAPQPHLRNAGESDNGATLTVGIIAGIVVGGIALIVVIVLLTLCITNRCGNRAEPYQGFADWRKDRNLTSVDIDRRNIGKPVVAIAESHHDPRAAVQGFETV